MAVLLLCADPNPRSLAQLKTARSHDIVVLPAADSELELFSYSDRAGQEALGYWREEMV